MIYPLTDVYITFLRSVRNLTWVGSTEGKTLARLSFELLSRLVKLEGDENFGYSIITLRMTGTQELWINRPSPVQEEITQHLWSLRITTYLWRCQKRWIPPITLRVPSLLPLCLLTLLSQAVLLLPSWPPAMTSSQKWPGFTGLPLPTPAAAWNYPSHLPT